MLESVAVFTGVHMTNCAVLTLSGYFLDIYDRRMWCVWTALVPPSLPPFRDRFRRLLKLLNCDVMISIMQLVLSRTTARWSKSWSEAQFEMVMCTVGKNCTVLFLQPFETFLYCSSYWHTYTSLNLEQQHMKIIDLF